MGRTTIMLGFSVPPPLAEEVEAIAAEEHRTKSELFREMLRVYQSYRRRKRDEEETRWVMQVIKEAQEEQAQHPITLEEELAEEEDLSRYGAAQAKKMGIETDEDVMRVIKEDRAERRRHD